MPSRPPPVPPANRSKKRPPPSGKGGAKPSRSPKDKNLSEQGRQGNIRQNTRNQGYQQDR